MTESRKVARPRRVAVIGAGIAGLTAARTLVAQGHEVVVLDKGRGPGGRASSRRRDGFVFDHGAQYFSVRDECFRRQVSTWREDGVIARWTPRLVVFDDAGVRPPREQHDRYVGVPGMSAIAKHLARGLDVRSRVRVNRLEREETGWRVLSADGDVLTESDAVVVTVLPAQALPLLSAAPELARQVTAVTMQPCWTVLLGLTRSLPVDFDGAFVNAGPLAWVARNSSKPGRDGGEAWVLHATADWSEQNLERDGAEVIDLLSAEFASRCVGAGLPAVAVAEAHRWRYAQPDPALASPYLFADDLGLGIAGDWCGGPRVEGAFLSGAALAGRILTWNDDGRVERWRS